jgi:Na+/H+ antiporter NhaB
VLTIFAILAIAAFIITIVSAVKPWPLWPGVLLLCIIELLRALPLGK